MVHITREHAEHFSYSNEPSPVAEVTPGTLLTVETLDTRSGQLLDRPLAFPYELPKPEQGRGNPVTGPIVVKGATRGDCLVVDVHAIEVGRVGWCGGHAHVGPTRDGTIDRPIGRTCEIVDGQVRFSPEIGIPIQPMIGCIGTAPDVPVPTALAGRHGGNMDQAVITSNTSVYLPVYADGGLVFIGDLHAIQGDGELSGVALEIPGTVQMTIDLVENRSLSWPWVRTSDHLAVLTAADTFDEARAEAVENMLRSVMARHRIEAADALALISIAGDLRVGQAYGGEQLTLRLQMPLNLGLSPVS